MCSQGRQAEMLSSLLAASLSLFLWKFLFSTTVQCKSQRRVMQGFLVIIIPKPQARESLPGMYDGGCCFLEKQLHIMAHTFLAYYFTLLYILTCYCLLDIRGYSFLSELINRCCGCKLANSLCFRKVSSLDNNQVPLWAQQQNELP